MPYFTAFAEKQNKLLFPQGFGGYALAKRNNTFAGENII
jgi:hypothetical protein